jgi:hypothetical protein
MSRIIIRLTVLSLASSFGCLLPSHSPALKPSEHGAILTTDAKSYVAIGNGASFEQSFHFLVVSRFENHSEDTMFLERCYPNSAQPLFSVVDVDSAAKVAPDDRPAYSQMWACVGHDKQIEVAPGTVRIDTLRVDGPNTFNGHTGVGYGKLEGIFRLCFVARRGRGERAPYVPYSERVSNPFTVRTAR